MKIDKSGDLHEKMNLSNDHGKNDQVEPTVNSDCIWEQVQFFISQSVQENLHSYLNCLFIRRVGCSDNGLVAVFTLPPIFAHYLPSHVVENSII